MEPSILHLHTYFLFPFSVDREAVRADHPEIWRPQRPWFDGVDRWIAAAAENGGPVTKGLGRWRRAAYSRFDIDSEAYQTMVFFHPFVRRVFFDAIDPSNRGQEQESLLNCHVLPAPERTRIYLVGEDTQGRRSRVEVTDLRLFLFANGIGILSIGVEARHVPATEALWINEMMRKIYPSSGRQIREGRAPSRTALTIERDGVEQVVVEERFEVGALQGYQPPLARTIRSLLYFADYGKGEYEPVLDERMLVYSYLAINKDSVPAYYPTSPDFEVFLSRVLYVDRFGESFRYETQFTRASMAEHLYRRWSHQGSWFGFTTYSNITVTFGEFDCDEHALGEGFLIHRMFENRYYLMAVIALFYRATLLEFAERSALVSKQLYLDQADEHLSPENIERTHKLRNDFLHFANYWYFEELANKDEEMEHFLMQSRVFRLDLMKQQSEVEIEKLSASLNEYFQMQSAAAVNRLAVSGMVLGAGAVITGYFGMNFAGDFGRAFFEVQTGAAWLHWIAIVGVTLFAIGAVGFGFFLIVANWRDFRLILTPRWGRWGAADSASLRRTDEGRRR